MIKAIDFFCGAGGLTRGLLDAGIEVLAGIDNDERLRRSYESNNIPSKFVGQDVRNIDIHELRRHLGILEEDVVLYAACTPCQPFSTLSRLKGKDERKHLLSAFGAIVQESPPDFILVENVPGLNTVYGREIYDQFKDVIEQSGFNDIYAELLDAKDFGVPQVRKRFILLASRHGDMAAPKRAAAVEKVQDHISKYPPIEDGGASDRFPNHTSRSLKPHHKIIVQAVPKDGGNRRDVEDTSILLRCHQEKPHVHKDVFGRMAWDRPAPTLTGRCTDVYCGRFTHPDQDRGISLREAAALQTFPDDYEFFGTFFHMASQIGSAVPVRFAKKLGEAVVASVPNVRG